MAADIVIGVDIGTQGVKAGLYDLRGRRLSTAFAPSRLLRPAIDAVEEDPEFQLASACRTIRQCISAARIDPARVAAMAFDGQMAGVIGIGRDGRNVTPYDSWLDVRCAPEIAEMAAEAGDEILAKTGCFPSINHGPKILRWKRRFRRTYKEICSFVQPAGYVAMRLCGLDGPRAFIDRTYLHFSGFADNRRARWDEDLCRRFGVDPAKLPAIVEPWAIVGEVSGSMARRCGLKSTVPIVAGCGDTAASFLACGATRAGICVDVAGTASVFAATARTFRADRRNRVLGCGQAATPGLWHPYAYVNGGGMNLEWFRRELAGGGREVDFARLNSLAERVKPRDNLPMFVPHLGGRVCPSQPTLRGAWVGLNWMHGLGHLYRSTLEGVALEYGIYRQILQSLYPEMRLTEIRITGGGGRSGVWNQIKADVLSMPVVRVAGSGGAAMGAALLAAFGTGLVKDVGSAANSWVTRGTVFRPSSAMRAYYARRLQRYQSLLKHLLASG